MDNRLLLLEGVTVQMGGMTVLEEISFVIESGEQWAIIGSSGSGKTTLAHTLLGRYFHKGRLALFEGKNGVRIGMVEQQHRFKNLSHTNDLYYQQRFNSMDAQQTITVREELLEYAGSDTVAKSHWMDVLHIRQLMDRPLIQLSNGENKRVQLATALISEPELLILDNPFTGLDKEGRETLHRLFASISNRGVAILLITSQHEIPGSVTHILQLEKGRIVFSGKKENFRMEGTTPKIRKQLQIPGLLREKTSSSFLTAVKMCNVHVSFGENVILENINWEVKKGERWNISGANGAGKSTLLSLLTADNPQAYANEIYLFDRRRGSGETIWEIKQKIGFVSPELQLYFDRASSCFDVVASGFFDTIGLFRPLTAIQKEKTFGWLSLMDIETQADRRFAQLSISQQRMALLARALIKNPPVLILDEPCQGLDEMQSAYLIDLIDLFCEAFDTTLIHTSHYAHEIPACVNRFLKLENKTAFVAGRE
jgi:molybdate transport system ATP-binding protein